MRERPDSIEVIMDHEMMDEIGRRMGRLEQENRRWRAGAAATALLGLGALALGAAGEAEPKTVAAERFLLTDKGGRKCAIFEVQSGRPSLTFFDAKGHIRISLGVQAGEKEDSASIGLKSADYMTDAGLSMINGRPSLDFSHRAERLVGLNLQKSGTASLTLGDHQVDLAAFPDGSSFLNIREPQQALDENRLLLGVDKEGGAYQSLSDRDGEDRFHAEVAANGFSALGLFDPKTERPRVGMALGADGAAIVDLFDRDERHRASLRVAPDGAPSLGLFDREGKDLFRVPPP